MKKAIVIAHNSRFIAQFELKNIELLKSMGYEVHCATNFENENVLVDAKERISQKGAILHQFDIERLEFKPHILLKNIKAIKQLKKILDDHYDIVLCHTPMGGVVTRLAAMKSRKRGTKVMYTVHGFHFYKGAPLLNWLLYYPVEKFLARFTDVLVTINEEDYERAKTFKAKKVCYVPGVGIDLNRFKYTDDNTDLRTNLGISKNDFVLLSVGEINANKNQQLMIRALQKLNHCKYVICGTGPLENEMKVLSAELGVDKQVVFAGFQNEIAKFYHMADAFVFPSFREGLSVALMEAMSAGLPCVASRIRGNVDLFPESRLLFDPANTESLVSAIKKATDKSIAKQEAEKNAQTLVRFSTEEVMKAMKGIYLSITK